MVNERFWAIMPDQLREFETSLLRLRSGKEAVGQAAQSPTTAPIIGSDRIAVVDISGVITRRPLSSPYAPEHTAQSEIHSAIQEAIASSKVRAIALRINSPGGVVAGVRELAGYIAACSKPVFAYADGLCASAAYWLAAATGRVYAPETTSIGSIGVIWRHTDASKMLEDWGLNITYITGGTWKAAGNEEEPLTDAVRGYYQDRISDLHRIFQRDVAATMPVDKDNPAVWGDGQIFLAGPAQKNGLICAVVDDFAAFLAVVEQHLEKEEHMTREELAASHPELMAELAAEAEEAAASRVEQAVKEKETSCKAEMAAALDEQRKVFALLAGEELAAKIEELAKAGIGAGHLEALQAVGIKVSPTAQNEPSQNEGRAAILSAITSSMPGPLPGTASHASGQKSRSMASTIDRIAQL